MNTEKYDGLSKTNWIERELTNLIKNEKLKPHTPIPPLSVITKKFGINLVIVRQAINNMVAKGLVYVVHGTGTFVSPPRRQNLILLVLPQYIGQLESIGYANFLFNQVLNDECNEKYETYFIMSISHKNFHAELNEIKHKYPQIRGVIVFRSPLSPETMQKLEKHNIPILRYASPHNETDQLQCINKLYYNHKELSYLGMEHLYKKRHRKIGIVGGSTKDIEICLDWFKNHSLDINQNEIFQITNFPKSVKKDIDRFLQINITSTAFFCTNDFIANHLINALTIKGIKVPEQIAVMGKNNESFCEMATVPITTVEIPVKEDAKTALRTIVEIIEGGKEPIHLTSKGKIIVRESV